MSKQQESYPPEPHWATTPTGRFVYTDYDGESLHVWGRTKQGLWVDKRGEGPVYLRREDVALIVAEMQKGPQS